MKGKNVEIASKSYINKLGREEINGSKGTV